MVSGRSDHDKGRIVFGKQRDSERVKPKGSSHSETSLRHDKRFCWEISSIRMIRKMQKCAQVAWNAPGAEEERNPATNYSISEVRNRLVSSEAWLRQSLGHPISQKSFRQVQKRENGQCAWQWIAADQAFFKRSTWKFQESLISKFRF